MSLTRAFIIGLCGAGIAALITLPWILWLSKKA